MPPDGKVERAGQPRGDMRRKKSLISRLLRVEILNFVDFARCRRLPPRELKAEQWMDRHDGRGRQQKGRSWPEKQPYLPKQNHYHRPKAALIPAAIVMISAVKKPRNARSKRALERRQPQVNEPVKTALFVTAAQSSGLVQRALTQLAALKKPYAISFSKKKSNDVNPFVDSSSIDFWAGKNDASLMLVGDSRKKRKDNLTWIRCFDGRVLDMLEMGVESMKGTEEFKVSGSVSTKHHMHSSASD